MATHKKKKKKKKKKLGFLGKITKKLKESFGQSIGGFIDVDDHLFNEAGKMRGNRDLPANTYDEMLKQSFDVVTGVALAKRTLELPIQALQSAGVSETVSDNETIQGLWEDLWKPRNQGFGCDFWGLFKDLQLNGELHLLAEFNPINADIHIAYIDPINVKKIITSPLSSLKLEAIVMKKNQNGDEFRFEIINKRFGIYSGQVFTFLANRNSMNSTRGVPILSTNVDWLRLLDDFQFTEAEHAALVRTFVFHFQGGDDWDEKEQVAFQKRNGIAKGHPLKSGTSIFSNADLDIKSVSPSLNASDSKGMIDLMRNNITGSVGIPVEFSGYGGSTANAANVREVARPLIWNLKDKQKEAEKILETIFAFYMQKAVEFGKVINGKVVTRFDIDDDWNIQLNEVFPKDFVANSTALLQLTNSLSIALSSGVIDKAFFQKSLAHGFAQLGMKVSADELGDLEEMAREQEQLEEADIDKTIEAFNNRNGTSHNSDHGPGERKKPESQVNLNKLENA